MVSSKGHSSSKSSMTLMHSSRHGDCLVSCRADGREVTGNLSRCGVGNSNETVRIQYIAARCLPVHCWQHYLHAGPRAARTTMMRGLHRLQVKYTLHIFTIYQSINSSQNLISHSLINTQLINISKL